MLLCDTRPLHLSWRRRDRRVQLGLDGNLCSELEAMHAKWFKGFDSGGRLAGVSHHQVADENQNEATTAVLVQSSGRWKIASAQWAPVTPAK